MNKTKLLAMEGIDGSGKGVQFRALKDALMGMGYTVASRDFPVYDSFFGREIGRMLSGNDAVRADKVDNKSMALWYALDRLESFCDYKDGETDFLILNRYVLSNAVYQSVRDIDLGKNDITDWIFELEFERFKIPKPDLSIVFSIAPESAEENVTKKGFRGYVGEGRDIYEASHSIQERAMAKYLELASKYSDIAVIPCMKDGRLESVDIISARVLSALRERALIR